MWSSHWLYHTISDSWNTRRSVPPAPAHLPYYWYHIRKVLYARKFHNSLTESVSCETYKQTMKNFKQEQNMEAFTKRCSFKIAVPEAVPQRCCIFVEFTLCHGCSPVNLWYNFGTLFYKNTSRRLLPVFLIFKFIKWIDF